MSSWDSYDRTACVGECTSRLSPNILPWIIIGNFSFTERLVAKYAGATAMYFVSKKLKKKYNITDERAALYDAAETWVDALNGRPFLGISNFTTQIHSPHFLDWSIIVAFIYRWFKTKLSRSRSIWCLEAYKVP